MKRILLYTDTPQIGGAEAQMLLLAKFLNKSQFTPIVCFSNYPQLDKLAEQFQQEGVKVLRLKVAHKHDPRHYIQLRKIIKEEEIDILHLHIWNPASCRYAFSAAGKLPIIITEHDPFKLSLFKKLYKKVSLKKVSKIIAISDNNAKKIAELYPKQAQKIIVIHNGIDTSWWQSQLLRLTTQEYIQIKQNIFHAHENSLIITSIAELHERKGIKYLIEAAAEVCQQFPNVKFVIIGEGKERKHLQKLIEKLKLERNIAMIGRKKNIPQLLKASNIFVLPSRREAFGLVVAEAMITGLPVIASKVGGIPEIVEDSQSGILVESENSKMLAKAILTLIPHPEIRSKMGSKGKERIQSHFDAKVMAKKYEKAYLEISS